MVHNNESRVFFLFFFSIRTNASDTMYLFNYYVWLFLRTEKRNVEKYVHIREWRYDVKFMLRRKKPMADWSCVCVWNAPKIFVRAVMETDTFSAARNKFAPNTT